MTRLKMDTIYNCLREKKSIFLRNSGLMRVNTAIFAVTARCNQQCLICDFGRYRVKGPSELSLPSIAQVLEHAICQKLAYIGITGGEPFLYSGIQDLREMLFERLPRAHVTISSNGTLTDEIMKYFSKKNTINKTFLELSLLGIGMHDRMTGVQDSLGHLKETMTALRTHCADVDVRIKFTITPQNYHDLLDVVHFCEMQEKPLFLKLIENVQAHQNMASYETNNDNPDFHFTQEQKKQIAQSLEGCYGAKVLYNKRHVRVMIDWLKDERLHRPCFANEKSIFVAQNGKIYFCRMFKPIATIETLKELSGKDLCYKRTVPDPMICESCISIFRSIM